MTVHYDRADVFAGATPGLGVRWHWRRFWRGLINALTEGRQRQADQFISGFMHDHPMLQRKPENGSGSTPARDQAGKH